MAENAEELRRRSALLWTDGARPSRGPKRALSADDVVQAALGIADRDGLAAVTMQAVAHELGFTPMALYRYFPSKDALVDALVDAALGTPPERTGPPGEWREEVRRWAYAKRTMLVSRPWLAELPFVAAPHGPNWLSWLEGAVEALALTGLGAGAVFDMLHALDGYVRGGSDTAIAFARAQARGLSLQEWMSVVSVDLLRAVGDPRYPTLSALITSGLQRDITLEDNFEFGLQRVLDGLELYVDARRAAAPHTTPPAAPARARKRPTRSAS